MKVVRFPVDPTGLVALPRARPEPGPRPGEVVVYDVGNQGPVGSPSIVEGD